MDRFVRCAVVACLAAGLYLAAALPSAGSAWAQADADRATARALGVEGSQALDIKDYKTAEDRFRRADRLVHAPTLMLGLARSLVGEGKFVEATETYNRIVREGVANGAPEPFKRALIDAKKEVDDVAAKIGSVTILVAATGVSEVPNLKALLDGTPLNSASMGVRRLVDPGAHTLTVTGDGFKTAEVRFIVPESGNVNEPVKLEPEPKPAVAPAASEVVPQPPTEPSPLAASERPASSGPKRTVLPWVAFGFGAAGLAVGAVTGFVAIGQSSDLEKACPQRACSPDKQRDVDAYHVMATVSDVGFVVGGLGVAAGVVLLLTQPKAEPEGGSSAETTKARGALGLRVTPIFGASSVGIVGQF